MVEFKCIRCGYTSEKKDSMRKHLYNKKKTCKSSVSDIELTEDIKILILSNDIEQLSKLYNKKIVNTSQTTSSIGNNTIINNYNNNNSSNYIFIFNNDDIIDKLTKYLSSQNKTIKTIGAKFSKDFEHMNMDIHQNIEQDKLHVIKSSDIFDIISKTSKVSSAKMEEINIIYNSNDDTLNLYFEDDYMDNKWITLPFRKGIDQIIDCVRYICLDNYEIYLFSRIFENSCLSPYHKTKTIQQLSDYYKFLIAFNQKSFVCELVNTEFDDNLKARIISDLLSDTDKIDLEKNKYATELYNKLKNQISASDIQNIRVPFNDIIKKNAKYSIEIIKHNIVDLLGIDLDFRQTIMGKS